MQMFIIYTSGRRVSLACGVSYSRDGIAGEGYDRRGGTTGEARLGP